MKAFFEQIQKLVAPMKSLNMTFSSDGDKLILTVLPSYDVKDPVKDKISPMILKGTPEDFATSIFGKIQQGLIQSNDVFVEISGFEKSVEEAKSKSEKAKKEKEAKKTEEAKLTPEQKEEAKKNEALQKKHDKLIENLKISLDKKEPAATIKELQLLAGKVRELNFDLAGPILAQADMRISVLMEDNATLFTTEEAKPEPAKPKVEEKPIVAQMSIIEDAVVEEISEIGTIDIEIPDDEF